jgi:hypothetical protein
MAVFNGARWARTALAAFLAAGAAAAADPRPLTVNVIEGEGAFNDIKKGVGRAPVVEIKDENGKAVENAKVVFQLPDTGAGGAFLDGSRTFVGTSDKQGRAAAPVLKPNKIEGQFAIVVTASKDGNTGRAQIRESNTLAGGQMMKAGGGGHGTALKIILAAASIGGGVAALVARGGGSNNNGGSTGGTAATPTSLSVGTVTVGGPR